MGCLTSKPVSEPNDSKKFLGKGSFGKVYREKVLNPYTKQY